MKRVKDRAEIKSTVSESESEWQTDKTQMHFMLILQHHKQYFLSHRGMNQWWLSGIPPLFPAAGTRHPGFSCHRGRVLEGAVLSDYFEWDCSVLYYSCGRTHAHDPATHLALVPMQPAVSEGLIKQFRSSGPSPSIALVFFFFFSYIRPPPKVITQLLLTG